MKVNNPTANSVTSGETSGARQSNRSSDAKKTGRASSAADAGSSGATDAAARHKSSENTEISPKSREFAQAKTVAGNTPDVREDRVAELKKRIAEKDYAIDNAAIADKLVDEHVKMSGMS